MSAAADFDSSDEWGKLVMKWNAAGHEVIHARSTLRLKEYRKDLDPKMPIQMDGAPMISSQGKAICVGDVLPERADLCLDMDGNVLPQHEFEKRYRQFLNWFNYIEGSDPGAEPIPYVARYVCQVPDEYSESPGMVEAGWDARVPAPEERTHHYDPEHDKMVEVVKQQGDALNTTLEAVKGLLENQPQKRGPGRPRKEV